MLRRRKVTPEALFEPESSRNKSNIKNHYTTLALYHPLGSATSIGVKGLSGQHSNVSSFMGGDPWLTPDEIKLLGKKNHCLGCMCPTAIEGTGLTTVSSDTFIRGAAYMARKT